MNRTIYYVIMHNAKTYICHWTRAGFTIREDARAWQELEAAAVAKDYDVTYCSLAHGIGTKTCEALCKQLGYDWEGHLRIVVRAA